MELIIPDIEIWEQDDIWAHIAKCTRVCYQSSSKREETDKHFVRRVILRNEPSNSEANHLAMLEHGTVYLTWIADLHDKATEMFKNNKYSRVVIKEKDDGDRIAYITTNLRVIIENYWTNYLDYMTEPSHHERRVTVSFITNIGVSREFNRHRVNSIAEESTRYCNYNKKNDGQLKIGLPAWLLDDEHFPYLKRHQFDELSSYCEEYLNDNRDINPECWCDMDFYLFSLTVSEYCYNMLIKKGWTPQQAREVLPLATKSQLIHTAFISDWEHFFKLRYKGISGSPHPNAKIIAQKLYSLFKDKGYVTD